jgi:predicted NBD/HSP70 family sugar kinase
MGIAAASGKDVKRLLEQGNPEAIRITREAGRLLGQTLATVVCLLNPGVLVISGDLASPALISGVRETLYPLSLPRATRHLDIKLGRLGEDAAIIGMAKAVVDQVFCPSAVDSLIGSPPDH